MPEYTHSITDSWWTLRHTAGLATRYSMIADHLGATVTGILLPMPGDVIPDTEQSLWVPAADSLTNNLPFSDIPSHDTRQVDDGRGFVQSWVGLTVPRRSGFGKLFMLPPRTLNVVATRSSVIPFRPTMQLSLDEETYRGIGHRKRQTLLELTAEVRDEAYHRLRLQQEVIKALRKQK